MLNFDFDPLNVRGAEEQRPKSDLMSDLIKRPKSDLMSNLINLQPVRPVLSLSQAAAMAGVQLISCDFRYSNVHVQYRKCTILYMYTT